MVLSFKEIEKKFQQHDITKGVLEDLNGKDLNDVNRLKEKSAEILKDFKQAPVDSEDQEFLTENIIRFCVTKNVLDKNINQIINAEEKKIIESLPPGYNIGALLHPDFPYSIGFVEDGFDVIITNHKRLMDDKKVELEKLKSQPNNEEIISSIQKLNSVLGFKAIDKKNEKKNLELVNSALSFL